MRAKSEIISTLTNRLTSDIWKKLKNGLLGRELIAFGAEVISENESIKDTMLLQLNPETADKSGLYLLSQMNEVPITNIKPNALVVQMASDSKTYAPFELTYSIGNNSFTNIEYTMRNKSVALVNGSYKCYSHNMNNIYGAMEDGEETYIYDNNDSYSCIKLGNAYPDSIIVTDEFGVEIPRYSSDIAMSNTIDLMVKVMTGFDGNQYVRFICAENVEKPSKFRIVWLDHSASEVDYDEDELSVRDNNVIVAEIKYLSRGSVDNIDYMREQLKKELAKYQGLNTPKSVERYVNGFPYVIDSRCVADNQNGMVVYVKPSENKDLTMYLDFSEIAAHVSLNSILFPKIKVMTGKRLNFGLQIDGVKDVIVQNNIKGLVQDVFAYDKMKFNSVVNTSQILSEVYNNFKIVPSIRMTIDEDFTNNEPMSYVPVKNSVKGYDSKGTLVAWENNEMLYGRDLNADAIPFLLYEVVGAVGKMFLLKMKSTIVDLTSEELAQDYVNINGENYNLYSSKVKYPLIGSFDVFYLYDVSTNMIKPFDNSMFNLLCEDSNPSVMQDSWNVGTIKFANLLDIELLSTNNGVIVNFIFKDSACDAKQIFTEEYIAGLEASDSEYELSEAERNNLLNLREYIYWNKDYTAGYGYYLAGKNYNIEKNIKYKGKYQTAFCVKQSPALMDLGSEGWEVKGIYDGVDNWFDGYYSGFKGINSNGINLKLKANGFYFENNLYYPVSISDTEIILRSKSIDRKIPIPLNGLLRGMIESKGTLYIVQERCITVVEGFSGLKQYCKIYNIYKDLTSPLYVDDIANGFNNTIIIKSKQNIYIADGFELLTDSKITFSGLRQIFTDVDTTECLIGSATSEFATCYKQVKDENQESYIFYCYDIKNNKTFSYESAATFEDLEDEEEGEENQSQSETQRKTWWAYGKTASYFNNQYKKNDIFQYEYDVKGVEVTRDDKLKYNLNQSTSKYTSDVKIDENANITSTFLEAGESVEGMSEARKKEVESICDALAMQYGLI